MPKITAAEWKSQLFLAICICDYSPFPSTNANYLWFRSRFLYSGENLLGEKSLLHVNLRFLSKYSQVGNNFMKQTQESQ